MSKKKNKEHVKVFDAKNFSQFVIFLERLIENDDVSITSTGWKKDTLLGIVKYHIKVKGDPDDEPQEQKAHRSSITGFTVSTVHPDDSSTP